MIVSEWPILLPGNGQNTGFYTIYPMASGGLQRTPRRRAPCKRGVRRAMRAWWAPNKLCGLPKLIWWGPTWPLKYFLSFKPWLYHSLCFTNFIPQTLFHIPETLYQSPFHKHYTTVSVSHSRNIIPQSLFHIPETLYHNLCFTFQKHYTTVSVSHSRNIIPQSLFHIPETLYQSLFHIP
jgi:hypothetical protein